MSIEREIGERVRRLREEGGWTQADFAVKVNAELGVTNWNRQAVWAAEKGRRALTAREMFALAESLGVTVGTLFGEQVGQGLDPVERHALMIGKAALAAMVGSLNETLPTVSVPVLEALNSRR